MEPKESVSQKLREQFAADVIKQRQGPGGRSFSYITGADVITRVIDATDNTFDFRILELTNMGNFFLARVSLSIPGLGEREGIGVQANIDANEDSIKGAITVGFKIAAKMFGVGLGLWSDSAPAAPQNFNSAPQMPSQSQSLAVREPGAPASEKQIYKVRAMVAERGGNPQIIDSLNVTKGKAHEWIESMMNGGKPEDLFPQNLAANSSGGEERNLYSMKIRRALDSSDGLGQFQVEVSAVREALGKPNADHSRLEWKVIELAKVAPTTGALEEIYDLADAIEGGFPAELSSIITSRYDLLMSTKSSF